MTFYQALQMSAATIKPLIKEAPDKKTKNKYMAALIIKGFLCIAFCILFASTFSGLFGAENAMVGIITVIGVLTYKLSNLGFDVKQSAFTIIGVYLIYAICPHLASVSGPFVGAIINMASIMTILILTCHDVRLANHIIFILGYFLLYGNPVTTPQSFSNRVVGLIVGGIIVAVIFYRASRKIEFKDTLSDVIKAIDFRTEDNRWKLKLALGITLGVFIGESLNIPKTMWIALACMSVLQPTREKVVYRCKARAKFAIIGGILFGIIFSIIPVEYRMIFTLAGGYLVGLCATYEWQVVFNAFGALSGAALVLGTWPAVIIRIVNNIGGAYYSKFFDYAFDNIAKRFDSVNESGAEEMTV